MTSGDDEARGAWLRLRRLGVHTHQEPVVYLREDSPVCRSEGFEAQSRVRLETGVRSIVASLNVVHGNLLAEVGRGAAHATAVLDEGRAWRKFEAICPAQGGLRTPPVAAHRRVVEAAAGGEVGSMDNRRLSRLAKLAGAPAAATAGLELHVHIGDRVERGQPLFTIHAETIGELAYAGEYMDAEGPVLAMEVHR